MKKIIFIAALSILVLGRAFANIRLPAVIGNNMVLQRNSSTKIWGWSEPGEKIFITTSWNNHLDSTRADGNASWQLTLPTPGAGGPYTITIKGNNTIVLQNILIGEVWVCSGQSNMEMNFYWGLPQMREDIPAAANPNIRFFHVPKSTASTPQQYGEGSWVSCDSNTVKSFSAVAYYFGRRLNAELNIPIGLIHASWSGSPAEVWTPASIVENDGVLKPAAQKLKPSEWWPITPGYAYNGMLAPLANFSIAGAIWYQGESNTGTASTYQRLLTSMIKAWRQRWEKEFPFYLVQIAPFHYGDPGIAAELREAQSQTLSLPGTGLVVTTDLADDTSDIHPRDKRSVGLRLANLALVKTYGRPIKGVVSPSFHSASVNKDRVVLSFENAEEGLMQKGKEVKGFVIAGADNKFYPATASISGSTITVWSKQVPQPVNVRYAFTNIAEGNVFGKTGLPLGPFRTDAPQP